MVGGVSAAEWPSRSMHWVVPYPAGGGTDIIARLVALEMEKKLGQPIVVENRPGASTIIGTTYVSMAKPDGYTFGSADAATLAYNPYLFSKLNYDVNKLDYIGGLARYPFMLIARSDSSFNTLEELLEFAKESNQPLAAASAGQGTPHHLALEMFKQATGLEDVIHVPYKGAAPALQDVLGGQVDFVFMDLASALPNIKGNKLKVLAVATAERLPLLPDVPTMDEAGLPGFFAYSWAGLIAPEGLPQDAKSKLENALEEVLDLVEVKKKVEELGVEVMPMSSVNFDNYAQEQRKEWSQVIENANIKLD